MAIGLSTLKYSFLLFCWFGTKTVKDAKYINIKLASSPNDAFLVCCEKSTLIVNTQYSMKGHIINRIKYQYYINVSFIIVTKSRA